MSVGPLTTDTKANGICHEIRNRGINGPMGQKNSKGDGGRKRKTKHHKNVPEGNPLLNEKLAGLAESKQPDIVQVRECVLAKADVNCIIKVTVSACQNRSEIQGNPLQTEILEI